MLISGKMSSTLRSDNGFNEDIEELLQIGTVYKELRKEKDILKESLLREKYKNAELIQRLETKANAASEAHLKDRGYIEELERELRNCSQEIEYLQDQLNVRHIESNCMGEHVHSLELKLAGVGTLHEKLQLLRKELMQSDSKQLILMQEVKNREEELRNSALQLEELEATVSSIALESQCEIESLKLDITALEEKCVEAERFSQQAAQDKARMNVQLKESKSQFQEAQERISCLEMENKELKKKLATSAVNTKGAHCRVAEHLDNWLKGNSRMGASGAGECAKDLLVELKKELPLLKGICTCEEVVCPFLSKPVVVTPLSDNVTEEMEKMSNQIREFELLVEQLKEELRTEKVKAKEEAEDLTQEMAELRYQITEMLEEECKRRACIEQASLRRIQHLEEQVRKEQKKFSLAMRRFQDAHELAEKRAMEVRHLKNALEGFRRITDPEISQRIESCNCRNCLDSETIADVEDSKNGYVDYASHQALIGWYPESEVSEAR